MLITPLYFTGYVGPFAVYPHAYAIVATTSCDKLALPKWRNSIPTITPAAPDDAVDDVMRQVAATGRLVLLFTDAANFKAWQRKLAQVTP